MIENKNDASRNLEKALQALEQAKQRVANEKKKQNEKKRKAENHHKYIMGGIVVKYFPDCYRYDEGELNRILLQSADNAEKFIMTRKIDSFESLANFTADKEQRYQQLETVHLSKGQKLNRLKELSKMYALYAPIQATYKESQSLKGPAKMKYDKKHKDSLSKCPELKERMQSLLQNGEKIMSKQWKAEIQSLQSEYDSIGKEQTKTATELAYAEVISYNKKNPERELQNESRQQNETEGGRNLIKI